MAKGAKPGERRGGRVAGTPNRVTAELKEFAGQFTREAVEFFVSVMRNEKAPYPARVAAANGILDRALGKPAQALTGPDGERLEVPRNVMFVVEPIPGSENQT